MAAAMVRPCAAALDATYGFMVGVPRRPATLPVCTMAPPPCSAMTRAQAWSTWKAPTTLTCVEERPSRSRNFLKIAA